MTKKISKNAADDKKAPAKPIRGSLKKADRGKITPPEKKFAELIILDGENPRQAALSSGWSEKNSNAHYRLLKRPRVQAYMAQLRYKLDEEIRPREAHRNYVAGILIEDSLQESQASLTAYIDSATKELDIKRMKEDGVRIEKYTSEITTRTMEDGSTEERRKITVGIPSAHTARKILIDILGLKGMRHMNEWMQVAQEMAAMSSELERGTLSLNKWLAWAMRHADLFFNDADSAQRIVPILNQVNVWLERAERIDLDRRNTIELRRFKEMLSQAHEFYAAKFPDDPDGYQSAMETFLSLASKAAPEYELNLLDDK